MRNAASLGLALAMAIAAPALAQTGRAGPPTLPGLQPNATPPGLVPSTGARPGHVPGVGESYPLSNRASNTGPGNTRSEIAPTLPTPAGGMDATAQNYLRDARNALAMGHTGVAQEAIERAETRMLDRSVVATESGQPDTGPIVSRLGEARRAVGRGDLRMAMQMVDEVLGQTR